MVEIGEMYLDDYKFSIMRASFRFIADSSTGPGWDFDFGGECVNDSADEAIFPYGARLRTEAAPMPLQKSADYTGVEVMLPLPYDDASGEPLFGLNVMEEHDLSDVRLRFAKKNGSRYRIELTGTVAKTVLGQPASLRLSAWTEELPDHAYPV